MHALTGAYAVDALDDLERVRFEQHLDSCAECAAEVRSFVETTAALGAAEVTAPPPGLRDSVLAEVARTRQEAPSVPVRRPRGAVARSSRWLAVAAAGLLVTTAGLGGLALSEQRDADRAERLSATVSQVLSTPGREVVDAEFAGGRAAVVIAGDEVLVMGDGVAAPPEDSVYVLWMLDAAGSPRAAGVVEPMGDGTFVGYTTGFRSGETLAVTVEKDPNTTTPHGDVVLATV